MTTEEQGLRLEIPESAKFSVSGAVNPNEHNEAISKAITILRRIPMVGWESQPGCPGKKIEIPKVEINCEHDLNKKIQINEISLIIPEPKLPCWHFNEVEGCDAVHFMCFGIFRSQIAFRIKFEDVWIFFVFTKEEEEPEESEVGRHKCATREDVQDLLQQLENNPEGGAGKKLADLAYTTCPHCQNAFLQGTSYRR